MNNYLNTVKMTNGKYKVVGGKVTSDKTIYVVKSATDQTRTGEVVGKMLFEDSFYNADYSKSNKWMGIIDPKSSEGNNFLNDEIYTNTPSNIGYATSWSDYDFKNLGWIGTKKGEIYRDYTYRGSQITDGVYASARDYGNIGAGYVAGYNGLDWSDTQFTFERFQALQKHNPFGNGIESHQTVSGEKFGWQTGYQKYKKYQFSFDNTITIPVKFRTIIK